MHAGALVVARGQADTSGLIVRVVPKTQTTTTFGAYLEQLLEGAGTDREKLASASGIDATTIGRWLRNERPPTIEKLRAVAPHLGVRLGDLIVGAGLATPAELGMVGAPPPPRAPLPAEIQKTLSVLLKLSRSEQSQLLRAVARTVELYLEMRNPPKEPGMRRRP